ncbi:NUDIX domain-containing protein [Segetibacter sp. 3557_3]|uniref:NUDIX domain-containing protein n=1 Tax=Segetibacter sp. 3557_3 TaxID=2547429 RepID=UPI0010583EB4|nr:NUDIX domain-containing protein [Segetibacter sp. 3557_3]TDH19738.1 NUDIX domain-containing protein [Segetibacter sp. 3557_3]
MAPNRIHFKNLPTHAGGVVYREIDGRKEYLVVTARRFRFIWVLPKGHIKRTEPDERAALREVQEESGVIAAIERKLGNATRRRWNFERQVVAFFLMRFIDVANDNGENRRVAWLPLQKAIRKLWYADQKAILEKVEM